MIHKNPQVTTRGSYSDWAPLSPPADDLRGRSVVDQRPAVDPAQAPEHQRARVGEVVLDRPEERVVKDQGLTTWSRDRRRGPAGAQEAVPGTQDRHGQFHERIQGIEGLGGGGHPDRVARIPGFGPALTEE